MRLILSFDANNPESYERVINEKWHKGNQISKEGRKTSNEHEDGNRPNRDECRSELAFQIRERLIGKRQNRVAKSIFRIQWKSEKLTQVGHHLPAKIA